MRIYQIYTKSNSDIEYYVRTHLDINNAMEECHQIMEGYCKANHIDYGTVTARFIHDRRIWSCIDYRVILYYREAL